MNLHWIFIIKFREKIREYGEAIFFKYIILFSIFLQQFIVKIKINFMCCILNKWLNKFVYLL